jgi:hypothetical protein
MIHLHGACGSLGLRTSDGQLFSLRLSGIMLAVGLAELIVAALVGQWVYRRYATGETGTPQPLG